MTDDFMALTLDVWSIPPESARRVGHPAPFPVELPEQLIRLYTFPDDLVLDPFMGSGSALVAAARLGRRYVGYDLDPAYVEIARAGSPPRSPTPGRRRRPGDPRRERGADRAAARRAGAHRGRVHGHRPRAAGARHRRRGRLRRHRRGRRDWYFDVAGPVHQPPRRAAPHGRRCGARSAGPTPCAVRRSLGCRAVVILRTAAPPPAERRRQPRCGPPARDVLRRDRPAVGDAVDRLKRYAKGTMPPTTAARLLDGRRPRLTSHGGRAEIPGPCAFQSVRSTVAAVSPTSDEGTPRSSP